MQDWHSGEIHKECLSARLISGQLCGSVECRGGSFAKAIADIRANRDAALLASYPRPNSGCTGHRDSIRDRGFACAPKLRTGLAIPRGRRGRSEHLVDALEREILEETGIAIHGAPRLHGIFSNFREFKGDRIAIYIVEHWHQMTEPRSKLEILEQRFFSINSLPSGLTDGARRRIAEVFESRAISSAW